MNPEEIIELAKSCGAYPKPGAAKATLFLPQQLLAFATEIRNRTIQECAGVCTAIESEYWEYYKSDGTKYTEGMSDGCGESADAILALKGDEK
jgi:hypothetical protein